MIIFISSAIIFFICFFIILNYFSIYNFLLFYCVFISTLAIVVSSSFFKMSFFSNFPSALRRIFWKIFCIFWIQLLHLMILYDHFIRLLFHQFSVLNSLLSQISVTVTTQSVWSWTYMICVSVWFTIRWYASLTRFYVLNQVVTFRSNHWPLRSWSRRVSGWSLTSLESCWPI